MIELHEVRTLPALMMWRDEVLSHVFGTTPSTRMLEENRRYYRAHIADGTHYAIAATYAGEDAGCGAVCFTDELPSPDNPGGRCAYLMNIYVRAPYRHHGIAHAIIKNLIDKALSLGCGKIYLETTADGRPVYESLGFRDMHDMMKYYD